MASRIIHLAIADIISKNIEINDLNRFKFGTILPDAYRQGKNIAVSHFKIEVLENTKLTYDLTSFRNIYKKELNADDLYLGYYMHLVQDLFFRNFVYHKYHWDPTPEGNPQRLHNDYKLLNTYIIAKHKITNNIIIPDDFQDETLLKIYPFDINQLLNDFKTDFQNYNIGNSFFFTEEMADEFIESASIKCIEEIKALKGNKTTINELKFAWNVHKKNI